MLVAFTLIGCATLQTVGRTTKIKDGIAIHLDAQQRLVLATAGKYCAEPSPDALSAYVGSLGLGVSSPGQGAASLVQSLQSPTSSIGLRTQSITLMRDALYRMCEASNNGHLNQLEVAAFLRRSQNLTAVVLAIEQLTGAVVGNQAILTADSEASASANLVSNQQLLDQAEQNVQAKQEAVTTAENTLAERRTELDTAKSTKSTKDQEYESARKLDPDGEETATKKAAAEQAEKELQTAKEMVTKAENNLQRAKQSLTDAEEVRDAIRASREAALTSVTAETSSSGQFSTPTQRNLLSPEATREIAQAVKEMVIEVLERDDMDDLCMSYLISTQIEREDPSVEVIAFCMRNASPPLQKTFQNLL